MLFGNSLVNMMTNFYSAWDLFRLLSLILGLLTALYIVWGIGRAAAFIADVIFEPEDRWFRRAINWLRGLKRVLQLWWKAPALTLPDQRLKAARYYTELQILLPEKALPDWRDYNQSEYKRLREDLEGKERERQERIRESLSERLAVEAGLLAKARDWVRHKMGWESARAEPLGAVRIEDFPQLDHSRPKIKHYFEALERLQRRRIGRVDDPTRFLTEARFEVGYIAPIFLITGLANRFPDHWKLVLDNYRRLIEKDSAYPEDLRELRSFLFNCWLLWGPSIQPCSCAYWQHDSDTHRNLMIQYGYGDEANSIDILIKDGRGPHFEKLLTGILNEHVVAAPRVAIGRFRWGPSLSDSELCAAQQLVRGGSKPEQRQPLNGRLVLECEHNFVTDTDPTRSSRYYSAYLWIAFVIRSAEGAYFFPEQRWKNLLVFFEHGNIADARTYGTVKEQLVTKVCATLTKILGDPDRMNGLSMFLEYVCAFDDTNCGEGHKALFRPEVTLLSMLRGYLETLEDGHILRSDRLRLPASTGPVSANPYASCHLPEIVEQFYADLVRPT
ncbi:MAG: hypothetical protein HC869_06475 [Rhodospirillales bacterium]|nr:hypothetical protein [Rhodospirillales bacterium]